MGYDRNAVLNVARAELGYREKASNAYLDDKTANSGSGNFTKYARDLDALGYFYNGPKQGYAYCDVGVDWCFVKAYGVEAALKLLCQPRYSAGAGCYYSAMYYKQCGQFHGPNIIPQPGDQIFFTYSAGEVSHTGIVESVSGNTITCIEFNTSDMVARRTYTVGQSCIYGYGRPDYGTASGSASEPQTPATSADTDDEITVLANEVIAGKWGNGAERVAALTAAGHDYTAVQARVNEILSGKTPATSTTPSTPTSSTPTTGQKYTVGQTNEATIFNFCKEVLGLNTAAACGVLANIEAESGFQIGAIGDGGMSYGICQWYASRCSSLKSWCGENGKTYSTLDGQLWYMKHELESTHSAVLKKLKAVADSAQGAYEAGYVWCSIFEVPDNTVAKSEARGNTAQSKYWPKYNGQTTAPAAEPVQTPAQAPAEEVKTYKIELPELKEGCEGSAVERVQTLLIARGLYCGGKKMNGREIPDGEFGPTTKNAVEEFQKASGLKVDGEIGADTMTALLK